MMKVFRYILIAVSALSLVACVEEQYKAGEPDLESCEGFYFPQDAAKDYMLTPSDPTVMEFKAERKNDVGEVSVEFKVSNDSIFKVGEIFFDDGQKVTTFKVDFSAAKTGVKYECTIVVDDPEYVSQYGLESNELTFSILRASWKKLGKGTWRDDFISSGFDCSNPYLETECDVYEREDKPGYYRIENVYTAEYLAELVDGDESMTASWASALTESAIFLDATDKSRAYIPFSSIGLVMGSYGDVYIYSYVAENYGPTITGEYGTLKDGIITMPAGSVVLELSAYGALLANQKGRFRLVLPGYTAYDYSLDLSCEEAQNGVIPVTFELGNDVAKVKYAVFDGILNDVELVSKIEQIKSEAVATKELQVSATLELTMKELPKTGFYTVVACSYDAAGNYQESASVHFGYDTPDDSREVAIKAGLIVSDRHAAVGLTSENSMEFYVYSENKDITLAKVALYKKSNYDDFKETIMTEVSDYMPSLDEMQLDSLNTVGYSGIISGLSAGTEYVLVVYAENGYHTEFFDEFAASTTGKFDVLQEAYTFYDLPERLQPVEDKTVYEKEWQLWSLDIYKEKAPGREFRSTVEIYDYEDVYFDENGEKVNDSESAVDVIDFMRLRGMFPETVEQHGIVNYIDLEFYNGFLYTWMTQMPAVKNSYPTNAYFFIGPEGWAASLENGAMVGGFTEDGVVAFVGNPMASINYIAMGLCYFSNADYQGNASIYQEAHGYPLLVSPDSELAHKTQSGTSSLDVPDDCKRLSSLYSAERTNYVETDRGYMRSLIDNLDRAPVNYMESSVIAGSVRENDPVDFSVRIVDSLNGRTGKYGVFKGESFVNQLK